MSKASDDFNKVFLTKIFGDDLLEDTVAPATTRGERAAPPAVNDCEHLNYLAYTQDAQRYHACSDCNEVITQPPTAAQGESTPRPWSTANNWIIRRHPTTDIRIGVCDAYTPPKGTSDPRDRANAALIVRCVNSHELLVSALREAREVIRLTTQPSISRECSKAARTIDQALQAATGD